MSSLSSTDWTDVSPDPDPSTDLEYDLIELDVIETDAGGRPQVLVLPEDENMLREDAFMVVEESGICDLETMV
jgi:hypothetical protein